MTSFRPHGPLPPHGYALAPDATARSGWVPVDLSGGQPPFAPGFRLGANLHDPSAIATSRPHPGSVPSEPAARERGNANLLRAEPKAAVPPSAFVPIGRPGRRGGPASRLRSANDNLPPPGTGPRRPLWRDVLFLALLFATIAGAFWSGRLHAGYRVIVVPGPSSARSVVT